MDFDDEPTVYTDADIEMAEATAEANRRAALGGWRADRHALDCDLAHGDPACSCEYGD